MFCSKCGNQVEQGTSFCSKCGNAVVPAEGAQSAAASQPQFSVRPADGQNQAGSQPTGGYTAPAGALYTNYNPGAAPSSAPVETPLTKLSGKMNVNGIIWIVVASLQVLIGLYNLITGIALTSTYIFAEEGTVNIISSLILFAVAAINFVSASKDIKYSKEILVKPVGIVAKFSPIGGYIGNLIYNFLLGGIVGVVGSIFALCIRNFVLNNRGYFDTLDAQFANQ